MKKELSPKLNIKNILSKMKPLIEKDKKVFAQMGEETVAALRKIKKEGQS